MRLSCALASAVLASNARLAQTWPDVVGEDLPVPYPLSDAEVETLRSELLASGKDHSGQELVPTTAEDGTESMPDPLEGADLTAIALLRAKKRGAHLYNVRLACKECHGENLGGQWSMPSRRNWYAPNISNGGGRRLHHGRLDRIIHHGVKPDDTNATMPAIDYMALSDQEIPDITAYATNMPAVNDVQPETTLVLWGGFDCQ